MDNKHIIIIGLVAVLFIVGGFISYNLITGNNIEYQTIALSNATTIEVPVSDKASFFSDDLGIKYYQDEKHGVQVISWNSQEELSLTGAVDVAAQFEKQKGGSTPTMEDGVAVYQNKESGYYIIEAKNETTHDNVMIMAKDKNVALHMFKSIRFGVSDISKLADVNISAPDAGNSNVSAPSQSNNENKVDLKSHESQASSDFDEGYEDDFSVDVETEAVSPSSSSSSSSSESDSSNVVTSTDKEA